MNDTLSQGGGTGADTFSRLFPGERIRPVAPANLEAARAWLNSLTKPVGSLGRLETLAARLWAMAQGRRPLAVGPGLMLTVAGDHGIAAQGVSPFPQAVTRQMVANFLAGGAAINVLCAANGLSLRVVDAGCAGGPFPAHPLLLDRRQGDGTADLSEGPAMSLAACEAALRAGFALAKDAHAEGFRTLGLGEMGIANSTAATALYCALLGLAPEAVAGPGAGAEPPMVARKARLVAQALSVNADAVAEGPVETMAALGGFEIAVMCGAMLGAAAQGMAVLVDGFISTSACAAALAMAPDFAGYAILTHVSAEPGYAGAIRRMTERAAPHAGTPDWGEPLLALGLRLGEGTGAALAWPLVKSAAAICNDMATMASAGVSAREEDRLA
ncbi:MAG: nicotinate-nucleotide--dimethylbenzimidazole phosphoribosyltransferase [Desulfovibrio sp.]|uniref:nicotinate-nucleotide--dimethylbenzimidazole phosphoribosyltransferase n=1 Tax=Desulfovibrio sp. TaxID=885 RepID=UPI001A6D70BB|nr:nicotinate-nucleotide--dimethylbenzimidazole phosphoribosyltransferase [Desulfovibrio sp.]MBD5416884.1 nicotinate-nucleotide--dimethylbenzimidazole phosphoribosyltransferase [Desulfovibrio sp.]